MRKKKIAISIDEPLLDIVNSYVDKTTIRSTSQAIEFLIRQAIKQAPITTAVILISEKDQHYLLEKIENIPLIERHVSFLKKFGINQIYLVTKENEALKKKVSELSKKIKIELVNEEKGTGTANALTLVKNKVGNDFLVVNGDTFNDFNLKKMINEHIDSNKVATIGLISSTSPHKRGAAILEGTTIIDFREKQETKSNIVNAGIYILKLKVFEYFDKNTKSLELDIFPKLAKDKQLQGFFTYGKFIHLPDQPF
ncbi:MAG: nucleotidyltransferase family protein [Nanoarchaeota archaeon]|nr:nucleotidyltransferase family protein [Nanoarchaeota archaeon]